MTSAPANRISRWAIPILLLVPFLLVLWYVRSYGVNCCHWDSIEMVPLFQDYDEGTLTFHHFFSQHNEHRLLVPRIVILALGLATDYNNVAEMYFSAACMLAVFLWMVFAYRDSRGEATSYLAFLPVSLLVFSWRQDQNLLFGIQLSYLLINVFALTSFALLRRLSRGEGEIRWLGLAALSGVLCTYSISAGMLVWPAGVVQILLSDAGNPWKRRYVLGWAAIGAVACSLYFVGYTKPGHHPPLLYALENPLVAVRFFTLLVGNGLFASQEAALPAGAAVLGCAAAVVAVSVSLWRSGSPEFRNRLSFWAAIVAFSGAILLSITIGRTGFGLKYASESRFTSYALVGVAALYAASLELYRRQKGTAQVLPVVVLTVLICISAPFSYSYGKRAGEGTREGRVLKAYVLRTYRYQPDDVLSALIYPNPKTARERAAYLERMRYNVFSAR